MKRVAVTVCKAVCLALLLVGALAARDARAFPETTPPASETAVIAISPTAQASTATRIEATLGVIARHRRKTWSQDTRLEKWCKAI